MKRNMANFKSKLKKPGKIMTFDDSDMLEWQASTQNTSESGPSGRSQAVLPRSVPNHLLFISVLEQLCIMYGRDTKQAQDIFKSICEQLSNHNVVSPLLMLDEMSSLRSQYRHSVHRMLLAAMHKSNKGIFGLSLPSNGCTNNQLAVIRSSIPPQMDYTNDAFMGINQNSRYSTEFVELEKIGKGGFGSVYKARNKLDGKLYAVKVVKFKHSKPENIYRVLREVKALANLQHTNIVGYNACWLEYGAPGGSNSGSSKTVSAYNHVSETHESDDIIFLSSHGDHTMDHLHPAGDGMPIPPLTSILARGPKIKEISSNCSSLAASPQSNQASPPKIMSLNHRNKSDDILGSPRKNDLLFMEHQADCSFATGSRNSTSWSDFPEDIREVSQCKCKFMLSSDSSEDSLELDGGSFESKPESRSIYKRSISCDPVASGEVILPKENKNHTFVENDFPFKSSVTLYIQMELCSLTLKEWMQKRNDELVTDDDMKKYTHKNMNIFKQILKAVDYIHSMGVMHRDLKPRNIFLTEDEKCVKVGDFGLATEDVVSSPVGNESFQDLEALSTRLVRTASVLSDHTSGVGTSTYAAPEQLRSSVYNTKCDVYSLGMILFELFQKYSTEMERGRSLSDLRKGIIPPVMYKNWKVQTKYIELMTNDNPEVRPSVKTMLSGELFLSKDQIIEDFRKREIENQKEIERLKAELKEKDRTIEKLLQDLNDTSYLTSLTSTSV